ncbi:hypothetical protein MTO96_033369 [Rhipicephalus appendiculatus]
MALTLLASSTALAALDGQLRRPAGSIVRDDGAIAAAAARLLRRPHSSRFLVGEVHLSWRESSFDRRRRRWQGEASSAAAS